MRTAANCPPSPPAPTGVVARTPSRGARALALVLGLVVVVGAGAGAVGTGCARGETPAPREGAQASGQTAARLSFLFTRIATGSELRFEAQGHFVRHAAADIDRVPTILGITDDDVLSVDSCREIDSAEELDRAIGPASLGGPTAMKLLDAGRLIVKGPADRVALLPRHYPELTPYVGGVVYGADNWLPLTWEPGGVYDVIGEGGDEIGPFSAQVAAPRSFATLDALPVYHRGEDLELHWDGFETSEPLVIAVAWSTRAGTHEVRCRVRDDGAFLIRHELLAAMPAAGRLRSAEVSVTRLRHGTLNLGGSVAGVARGVFTLGLRSVWALPVSSWPAANDAPGAGADPGH